MSDIDNPYMEQRQESQGEKYVRLGGEIVKFIQAVGGPKLDQDAVSTILGEVLEWFKHLQ